MPRSSALRASDADRDAIAARLRQATLDGRLDAEEFEDRLGAALRARTYGELRRLVADLPTAGRAPRRMSAFALALRVLAVLVVLAVVAAIVVLAAAWW